MAILPGHLVLPSICVKHKVGSHLYRWTDKYMYMGMGQRLLNNLDVLRSFLHGWLCYQHSSISPAEGSQTCNQTVWLKIMLSGEKEQFLENSLWAPQCIRLSGNTNALHGVASVKDSHFSMGPSCVSQLSRRFLSIGLVYQQLKERLQARDSRNRPNTQPA